MVPAIGLLHEALSYRDCVIQLTAEHWVETFDHALCADRSDIIEPSKQLVRL